MLCIELFIRSLYYYLCDAEVDCPGFFPFCSQLVIVCTSLVTITFSYIKLSNAITIIVFVFSFKQHKIGDEVRIEKDTLQKIETFNPGR